MSKIEPEDFSTAINQKYDDENDALDTTFIADDMESEEGSSSSSDSIDDLSINEVNIIYE